MADLLSQITSSSSSSIPRLKFDVFLSFRGEDTRKNFISHLHTALRLKGIHTFVDNEQTRGKEIRPSLTGAIESSKISIIVFSEDYASSAWCLDELVKIMECKESLRQLVCPIFFYVEPSVVRNQTHSFGEALAIFQADSTHIEYKKKLPKWKDALTKAGNLAGWHMDQRQSQEFRDESQLIQNIVEVALSKLNRTPLHVAKHPVGVEARVKDLDSLMNLGLTDDVQVIGIHGIGGVGKTTIAKAVFNEFADKFEGASFLANVRETSNQYGGLVQLQETLLFDMLGDTNLKVGNTHRGINIIRARLGYKRLLLVLDDVDQLEQLDTLAGGRDWFGSGSRIIITTRYKHFLTTYGANETYEVKGLDCDEALELLSWNAFKGNNPVEDYCKLSKHIVGYTDGLPLALVVLGSFLCKRSKPEWESAINNLESKPNKQVYEILKISYDDLQDYEKAIFLDIACFLVGDDKDHVNKVLGSSFNFSTAIGIKVLLDMSLITIESDKVRMHQLLQEVGWEIVRQESPEVGKRSRLWFSEDVFYVFLENTGTNAIEGIKLESPEQKTLYLSAKAFKKMKRLRLLILRNVVLSTAVEYLPTVLRYIDWPGYQFPTLPFNPGPKQLVILNMPHSHIHQLGEGFKNFENLKFVNLSFSKYLTKIPNISTVPKLESLNLEHCTNLVEIDESVGSLNSLEMLNLESCCNLSILPSSLRSKSLGTLNFANCSRLESFPKIFAEMKNLKKLYLSATSVKELHPSIHHLVGLEVFDLASCKKLMHIPTSIYKLHNLEHLGLGGCSNLSLFPKSMASSGTSKHFQLSELLPFVFQMDPESCLNFAFPKLKSLDLQNCNLSEVDFLMTPNGFHNLQLLNLAENKYAGLPSFVKLSKLLNLNLTKCELLREIPELPESLRHLNVSDCELLLEINGSIMAKIIKMRQEFLKDTEIQVIHPGGDIPRWFDYKCECDFISFVVPPVKLKKMSGVIIGAVFE